MTHFLEVGSMREDLAEILKSAQWLKRLLSMSQSERMAIEQARVRQGDMTTINQDTQAALQTILERSEELLGFLDRFESSPIIYTGEGSTQEVLAKLQRLAAIARESGEEL
ncbi:MAG: hypothetical protein ACOY94_08900 [Bacillota bacterium]